MLVHHPILQSLKVLITTVATVYRGFHYTGARYGVTRLTLYRGKIFQCFMIFYFFFYPEPQKNLSICSESHSHPMWKKVSLTIFESITTEQSISSCNNVSLLLRINGCVMSQNLRWVPSIAFNFLLYKYL